MRKSLEINQAAIHQLNVEEERNTGRKNMSRRYYEKMWRWKVICIGQTTNPVNQRRRREQLVDQYQGKDKGKDKGKGKGQDQKAWDVI